MCGVVWRPGFQSMLMRDGSLTDIRETRDERREGFSERFRPGDSLPDEFRVEADEVYLQRTPEGFLVIPRDPWEVFYEGVEELSDGFFREGRGQPPVEPRDWKP